MAGNRIKGITIEIGGDTTKLQKALSGVDKSLKDTQAKLKDVDKLLQFDPKNTELLTQKQKGLKDAVELTKVRLEALKEAQAGVAKGSDEWDAIQREIVDNEQSLKSLEKEYNSFGSVAAQQIAAVGKDMQNLGGKITEVGQKLTPVSAAAGGFAAGLVKLGYDAVTGADDLNTLAKQTGVSTDYLQKLKYSSDLIDVSMEDVTGAMAKMKKNMDGGGKAFKELGIEVTNADGSMRSVEDIFNDTIVTLSHIENGVERDQAAMSIFGKSADSLAGIIDDGGEALKEYGQQAEDLGLIMSGDTLNSLNEINDAIDTSKAQVGAATAELGATVAQALLPLVEPITQGIQRITELLQSLTPEQTQMILGVLAAVAALAPLVMVIGGVISSIGTVLTLAPVIMGVMSAILSPIGLIVAAVVGLGIVIYKNWDDIKAWTQSLFENIKTKFEEIKKKITETWQNIQKAISDRITAIKTKVTSTFNNIKSTISNACSNVLSTAKSTFENVKKAITDPIDEAKRLVSSAIDSIKSLFSNAKFEFPHIKLPHFSWDWQDIGGVVKIPKISVDWYAKAMQNPYLFTAPTVMQTPYGMIGAGEAGNELMYGHDSLMRDITAANAANNEALINGVYQAMSAALEQADLKVVIGRREFARIVREVM